MRLKLYMFLIGILGTGTLLGQSGSNGAWYMYQGSTQINKNWSINHILQFRSQTIQPELGKVFFIGGATYRIPNTGFSVRIGFNEIDAYQTHEENFGQYKTTRKLLQWIIHDHKWGKVKLREFWRQEQIWTENQSITHLTRFYLGADFPVTKKEFSPGGLYLSVYSETFLDSALFSFDRNRFYGGLGVVVKEKLKGQLGFMTEIYDHHHVDQWLFSIHQKF